MIFSASVPPAPPMASGGDVMDILNVSRAGRGDPASLLQSPPPPKGEKERKRKPGTHQSAVLDVKRA